MCKGGCNGCAMGVQGVQGECAKEGAMGVQWVCKGWCIGVCKECRMSVQRGVQGVQDECAEVRAMGVQGVNGECAKGCAMCVQCVCKG